MKRLGILGLVALVGAGIVAATAMSVKVGDIGSLDEREWLGIGA